MKKFLIILSLCVLVLQTSAQSKVCNKTSCSDDHYFSWSDCRCKWYCADYSCNNPIYKVAFNAEDHDCDCVCANVYECTGFNQRWSNSRCGCRCKSTLRCSSPLVYSNVTCNCECPAKSCPGNQVVLKNNNCNCGCANPTSCASNQYYDTTDCGCKCNVTPCGEGKFYDQATCSCKCINSQTCTSAQSFNLDKCGCECSNDQSADCNSRVPYFGWNIDECKCDFCPNSNERGLKCEEQAGNYTWDAVNCQCEFCIKKDEAKVDCDAKGSPWGWSATNCDCTFCLNRDALRLNCLEIWDDEACRCIPTTTTTTTTTQSPTEPPTPVPCIESNTTAASGGNDTSVGSGGSGNDTSVGSGGSNTTQSSDATQSATTQASTAATAPGGISFTGEADFGAVFNIFLDTATQMLEGAFDGMSWDQIVSSLLSGIDAPCCAINTTAPEGTG